MARKGPFRRSPTTTDGPFQPGRVRANLGPPAAQPWPSWCCAPGAPSVSRHRIKKAYWPNAVYHICYIALYARLQNTDDASFFHHWCLTLIF